MLSGLVLKPAGGAGRFERLVERFFDWLADRYQWALH
jgi:hypothetical protein